MLRFLVLFFSVFLVIQCGEYNKVLTSTDVNYKRVKADQYFKAEDCEKSTVLYKELLQLYKGTPKARELYYKLAESYFCQESFLLSAYYFKNYEENYLSAEDRDKAAFMVGKSYQEISAPVDLDQEQTFEAIAAYRYLLDVYPDSEYANEARNQIALLDAKILEKEANRVLNYLFTYQFKPSIQAINTFLEQHPKSPFEEEMKSKLVESYYHLTLNSVEEKKLKRCKLTLIAYRDFLEEYPSSVFRPELDELAEKIENVQRDLKS